MKKILLTVLLLFPTWSHAESMECTRVIARLSGMIMYADAQLANMQRPDNCFAFNEGCDAVVANVTNADRALRSTESDREWLMTACPMEVLTVSQQYEASKLKYWWDRSFKQTESYKTAITVALGQHLDNNQPSN